jgi:hypothetical protein
VNDPHEATSLTARVKAMTATERTYALYWLAHDPDGDDGRMLERALDEVDRHRTTRELIDRETGHDPLAAYHSPFTAKSVAEVDEGVQPAGDLYRTATPAEHADTAERIERARTGLPVLNADGRFYCAEQGPHPNYLYCCEPAGHAGDHIARTADTGNEEYICGRWPQATYVENITAVMAQAYVNTGLPKAAAGLQAEVDATADAARKDGQA